MEKLAYSINETARALSMGRTSIYAMIAEGRLEAFKLGRRTLIKADSIRRLVDGQGWLSRFIVTSDRGEYIRTPGELSGLLAEHNPQVDVRQNLLRIPFAQVLLTIVKD